MISEADLRFLSRRRRSVRSWKAAAAGMLTVLAAVVVWLALRTPTLINPLAVADRLGAGGLDHGALAAAALLLPFAVLGCFGMVVVIILFGFAVIANERRYLRILDALGERAHGPGPDRGEGGG